MLRWKLAPFDHKCSIGVGVGASGAGGRSISNTDRSHDALAGLAASIEGSPNPKAFAPSTGAEYATGAGGTGGACAGSSSSGEPRGAGDATVVGGGGGKMVELELRPGELAMDADI